MLPQGEPRTICLTCGTIYTENPNSCPKCKDALKKPILIPYVDLKEPQPCYICGKESYGGIIETDLWNNNVTKFIDLDCYLLGYFCGKCGVFFCRNEKLPKQSFWSGLKNAICPRCNDKVAPSDKIFVAINPEGSKKKLAGEVYFQLLRKNNIDVWQVKKKLLDDLENAGPQVINLIFEKLNDKNRWGPDEISRLATLSEIGAAQLLINEQVEKRLLEVRDLYWLVIRDLTPIIQIINATRSGQLIPQLIEWMLDRKTDVTYRSLIAERLGEITWDPRVVAGLEAAFVDHERPSREPSLWAPDPPSVANLAYQSREKIFQAQKTSE